MKKIHVFIALPKTRYRELFDQDQHHLIQSLCSAITWLTLKENGLDPDWNGIEKAEILITGWGTPDIPTAVLQRATSLQLILHAGATPKLFQPWLYEQNDHVRLSLATTALARSVAEFTFSLMTIGSKRGFWMERRVREGGWRHPQNFFHGCFELFKSRIGLIGGGEIARQLMALLSPLKCQIEVYDPYIDPQRIISLGGTMVDDLESLFRRNQIVSLHVPHNSETHEMIRSQHFLQLQDGSLFINTSRGPILHEQELIHELRKQRFIACLDVSNKEPLPIEHPFRSLPNVLFTPHIAGAIAENRFRLGQAVTDELERFINDQPLHNEFLIPSKTF